MTEKLRPIAVEEYSKSFARKVCSAFFANQLLIGGKEILSFSNVYQVNLFIIYKIFDRWQQETGKLKSAYFDYSHPEVADAMTVFMNSLSQHIAVKQEDFEPLVARAVGDTIRLILTPYEFFKTQLSHYQVVRVERLKEMMKYVHQNKFILKELVDKLEAIYGEEVSWEKSVAVWNDVYQQHKHGLDSPDIVVEILSKKVPLYVEDLRENPRTSIPLPNLNLTSALFESNAIDRTLYPPKEKEDKVKDTAKINANDNISYVGNGTNHVNGNDDGKKLHEIYQNGQPTVNEKAGENVADSFLQRQKKQKIDNIKTAVTLNQKFIFTGELFGGDAQMFHQALDEVESCRDYLTATSLLANKYAMKCEWDMHSPPVQEFLELVERRFA
ncbi:MAG: hypothetical protein H7Y04_12945 [Verrucomicrobia bacterium]|nr:hypothetical protein [Cytophagales bacterium]